MCGVPQPKWRENAIHVGVQKLIFGILLVSSSTIHRADLGYQQVIIEMMEYAIRNYIIKDTEAFVLSFWITRPRKSQLQYCGDT